MSPTRSARTSAGPTRGVPAREAGRAGGGPARMSVSRSGYRALGRPRRPLRRERAAGSDRSPSAPSSGKEASSARSPRRVQGRREVRRRRLLRPAREARAPAARRRRHARLRPAVVLGERLLALGEQRCARIGLSGVTAPNALDGVDPQRAGRDQLPFLQEAARSSTTARRTGRRSPAPSPGWAELVHPGPRPRRPRSTGSGSRSLHVLRLDEPTTRWPRGASAPTRSSPRPRG